MRKITYSKKIMIALLLLTILCGKQSAFSKAYAASGGPLGSSGSGTRGHQEIHNTLGLLILAVWFMRAPLPDEPNSHRDSEELPAAQGARGQREVRSFLFRSREHLPFNSVEPQTIVGGPGESQLPDVGGPGELQVSDRTGSGELQLPGMSGPGALQLPDMSGPGDSWLPRSASGSAQRDLVSTEPVPDAPSTLTFADLFEPQTVSGISGRATPVFLSPTGFSSFTGSMGIVSFGGDELYPVGIYRSLSLSRIERVESASVIYLFNRFVNEFSQELRQQQVSQTSVSGANFWSFFVWVYSGLRISAIEQDDWSVLSGMPYEQRILPDISNRIRMLVAAIDGRLHMPNNNSAPQLSHNSQVEQSAFHSQITRWIHSLPNSPQSVGRRILSSLDNRVIAVALILSESVPGAFSYDYVSALQAYAGESFYQYRANNLVFVFSSGCVHIYCAPNGRTITLDN